MAGYPAGRSAEHFGQRLYPMLGSFARKPEMNSNSHSVVTSLCPGGKERMRRLMNALETGRADLRPLVTHRCKLDEIEDAYELFAHQRDGVLKVALTP